MNGFKNFNICWSFGTFLATQEQELAKQKLLFEQGRLADRYVSEMVLLSISACHGEQSNMMLSNLQLGISILMDGNIDVQKVCQHVLLTSETSN